MFYASTTYILLEATKKSYILPEECYGILLLFEQQNWDIQWCFMGDFNVILETHKYKGHHNNPDRMPIKYF